MKFAFSTIALVLLGFGLPIELGIFRSGPSVVLAQTVPEAVGRAYGLLDVGWVDDAIAAFEEAVVVYPDSVPARLGLAIAYRRSGRDGEALVAYERVLDLDPGNLLALKSIGLLGTYRLEWRDRGIAALTTLLDLEPGDAEARGLRALLYGYEFRLAEALADYRILLDNPNPAPDVLLGAAQIYTYSGDPQTGLMLFDRYRGSGGAISGYAAIANGRALRETGNFDRAIGLLESQLNGFETYDDPQVAIEGRVELARAYLASGQPQQALASVTPLRGRPEAVLPLARALNEIGRQTEMPSLSGEAVALYRQALTQTPNPPITLVREVADVLSGIPEEREYALDLYRQLVAAVPDDPVLAVQKLTLESQLGGVSPAQLRPALAAVLSPLPADPLERQRLAGALVRLDPPDSQFLDAYQELVDSGVDVPLLHFRIAQIFVQRNDFAGARQALDRYEIASGIENAPISQLLLAQIERTEGNLEQSDRRYQDLLANYPEDEEIVEAALRGLVGVRLAQNRTDAALELYERLVVANPDDVTLQLGRTSLAYQQQLVSLEEAEAVLENWLQTQPQTAPPQELLSLVGILPPDLEREELYERLLEIDPYYLPVQFRLVQTIAIRDPEAARAWVAREIERNPDNVGVYFLQGEFAQNDGDLDIASAAYEAILQREPDNSDALAALGGVRFGQRQFNQAQVLYERALALDPGDFGIRRSLAGLTVARDRPLAALEQLEALQLEQIARGIGDPDLSTQIQQIQEDFLRRRGFQPPWERY